ncbi:MAG: toll/interleukin-1 receptor domain-containing protein [Isosphaerales bacterium]
MSKIFLSYRRQDSAALAGRIYDRLCTHFGSDAVFMDIYSISFGVDFREQIDAAVGQCDLVLAVIGTNGPGKPTHIDGSTTRKTLCGSSLNQR